MDILYLQDSINEENVEFAVQKLELERSFILKLRMEIFQAA